MDNSDNTATGESIDMVNDDKNRRQIESNSRSIHGKFARDRENGWNIGQNDESDEEDGEREREGNETINGYMMDTHDGADLGMDMGRDDEQMDTGNGIMMEQEEGEEDGCGTSNGMNKKENRAKNERRRRDLKRTRNQKDTDGKQTIASVRPTRNAFLKAKDKIAETKIKTLSDEQKTAINLLKSKKKAYDERPERKEFVEQKIREIENERKLVDNYKEYNERTTSRRRFWNLIKNNREFHGMIPRFEGKDEPNAEWLMRVIKNLDDHHKKKNGIDVSVGRLWMEWSKRRPHYNYNPKNIRELLMEDIGGMVRVYSDEVGRFKVPGTMIYLHIDRNIIPDYDHPQQTLLKKFQTIASKNIVKCDCIPKSGTFCACRTNANCPCNQLNNLMRNKMMTKDRKVKVGGTFDEYQVYDHTFFSDCSTFACSEECACKGRCSNNVFHFLDTKFFKFEVFIRSATKGAGVRTMNYIPPYTPVLEFTGEIIADELASEMNARDYSMDLSDDSGCLLDFMEKNDEVKKLFSKEFVKCYKEVWTNGKWKLNPKEKGNVARFLSHSCDPNLVMLRVFQKGLTPGYSRLILVSNREIYAGTELSFDYGQEYLNDYISKCECGSLNCDKAPGFETIRRANDRETIKGFFTELHKSQKPFMKRI